jgi:hypothetical protein
MAQLKGGTTIAGSEAWHAGNDGAGSGLDADLLDGYGSTTLPVSTAQQTALNRKIDLTRITSSATDTTAGRLLKVGDFGVGGVVFISDANVLASTGFYLTTDTWTGSVITGTSGANQGYLFNQEWSGSYAKQTFFNINDTWQTWTRRKDNDVWTAWVKDFNQNNILGTVSQTAGVPTGAIIESGSNANGSYVELADGTLTVQTITLTVTLSDSATALTDFTFPASFIDTSYAVVATPEAVLGGAAIFVYAVRNKSINACQIVISTRAGINATGSTTLNVMIKGRSF